MIRWLTRKSKQGDKVKRSDLTQLFAETIRREYFNHPDKAAVVCAAHLAVLEYLVSKEVITDD